MKNFLFYSLVIVVSMVLGVALEESVVTLVRAIIIPDLNLHPWMHSEVVNGVVVSVEDGTF
tara:strand:- start:1737 stop:1919 length:183 start_codon:yes stop_codon:yes gene_type:complete